MPKSITVNLADLTRDERLRYRSERGLAAVERTALSYADAMDDYGGWGEFPPLTVLKLSEPFTWKGPPELPAADDRPANTYPAGTLLLVGGSTRCRAADLLAARDEDPLVIPSAPAELYTGTWEDAHHLAWRENARPGHPRTADDLELVLTEVHLRPQYRDLGVRRVAHLAGCTKRQVVAFRAGLRRAAARTNVPLPFTDHAARFAPKARDRYGREVPEAVAAEFRDLPRVDRAVERVRKAVEDLGALKHPAGGEPPVAALDRADVRELVATVMEAVETHVVEKLPFIPCPRCDGAGQLPGCACPVCKGEGFLVRAAADALPPDLERKARGDG